MADTDSVAVDESRREAVLVAARAADDKSGADTVVLDVADVLGITDHFVVTSAGNRRLVRALAEEIERAVGEACGIKPIRVEGQDALRWVLLDYGDFVAHVFLEDEREYYALERLWSDVPRIDWRATTA